MADAPLKVVQFGTGVFLRGYFDWMLEVLHRQGHFDGTVAAVRLTKGTDTGAFGPEGGDYTHVLRGVQDGHEVEEALEIRRLRRWLQPFEDWPGFLALAREDSLRVVVSNSTEAGLRDEAAAPRDRCPATFPARLSLFLEERFRHFQGDPERGLVVMPFELVEDNAGTLRALVLEHARRWRMPAAFGEWIEQHCPFVETLVDRIVPTLGDAERRDLAQRHGADPARLSVSEPYHLMVLRGPRERVERDMPLSRGGLNVSWVDDLAPWRRRKVLVLNGAHTAMVGLGLLLGRSTVRECIQHPLLGRGIRRMLHDEVVPCLAGDASDLHGYADQILERFENPTLHHRLGDIALNGLAKTRTRLIPTLLESQERTGAPPALTCLAVAAILRLSAPEECVPAEDRTLQATVQAGVREDEATRAELQARWEVFALHGETEEFVRSIFSSERIWNPPPRLDPSLSSAIARSLRSLLERGAAATLAPILDES